MSTMETDTACNECGTPTNNGICTNVDCCTAQHQATRGASRATAKAGAMAASQEPRAFTSSGRVD